MKFNLLGSIMLGILLTACQHKVPADEILNQKASLPASFGLDTMQVIASSINKKEHTTSTLYGSPFSVKRARLGGAILPNEKLLLVTWVQKADKDWFGANIPGQVKSAEQVITGATVKDVDYHKYEGNSYVLNKDTIGRSRRINVIFGMQASIMP